MTRPWEENQGRAPWQAAQPLFDRVISIYRQATELAPGNVGYMGQNRTTETLLFSGIAASIQATASRATRSGDDRQPYDAPGPVVWNIIVPFSTAPLGGLKTRDIVVDDVGDRYQVSAAYPDGVVWKLASLRLDA